MKHVPFVLRKNHADFWAHPTRPHAVSSASSATRMARPLPGCAGTAVRQGGPGGFLPAHPAPRWARLGKRLPSRPRLTQLHQSHLEGLAKPRPHSASPVRTEGPGAGRLVAALSQQACAPAARRGGDPRPQVLVLNLDWPGEASSCLSCCPRKARPLRPAARLPPSR